VGNLRIIVALAGVLLLSASPSPLSPQSGWQVKNTLHVGGGGGWDYLTVDPQTRRLFVPRGTHTMVLDSNSGKVLGDIPGQKVAHGVAIVPSLGRGFITDGGGSGAIVIFDLNSYAVLGTLPAWPDSDGIIYDADQNLVLAVSGDKGLLMTFKPDIDPKTGMIGRPIALGGSPEFLTSDGKGKVFVNLEDKDLVAVVDLHSRQVVARWPVAPGGHPVGMAMDRNANRLFVGCRKPQKMVVMSAYTGEVLDALPIGDGVDATAVDAGKAFASCRDGSFTVVAENAGKYKVIQVVKTLVGARTMGVDPVTHTIYLPTADFESQPANSTGRPKQKPDSFMIVEVGK
jgi:hypothetical protein